jgi:4-hydroxymandelate oxidase
MAGGWLEAIEAKARGSVPPPVAEYYWQGSGEGLSASEANGAWQSYRLLPRMLRDVSSVDSQTTLLGTPINAPIAIAPTALLQHAHPRGEAEMAAGARGRSLICVSSNAGIPYADIAAEGAPWWAQVYVLRRRSLTESLLVRAVAAGAKALVLTVDTPIVATKRHLGQTVWEITTEHFLHANEDMDDATSDDLAKADDLTPDVIGWLGEKTGLPVVVKGVLRPDDARRAVDAGAAAIWVSNHGGRQLDRSVATAHALSAVAAAVGTDAEIYVDGGIRSGLDVLTALALGARAAFIGRPALWGLTTGGADGVRDLMAGLAGELDEAMMLAGAPDLGSIGADLLVPRIT